MISKLFRKTLLILIGFTLIACGGSEDNAAITRENVAQAPAISQQLLSPTPPPPPATPQASLDPRTSLVGLNMNLEILEASSAVFSEDSYPNKGKIVRTYTSNENMFARSIATNANEYSASYRYLPLGEMVSRESAVLANGSSYETTYSFKTSNSGVWEESINSGEILLSGTFTVRSTPVHTDAKGDRYETLSFGGRTRSYLLHFPPDFSPSENLPLLIVLHGSSGHSEEFKRYTRFDQIADRERAILLVPQAATELFNGALEINWDSDVDGLSIDDVGFLTHVLDDVETAYTPDTDRIYTTGFSNGAWMTIVLACALNDRIDGMAPVAGLLPLSRIPCLGEKKIPIIYTYGTQDLDDLPGVMQSNLDFFATELSCGSTQTEAQLPDIAPEDMTTVTHIVRDDCPLGVGLEYYRVNNGTHTWPGASIERTATSNQDIDTSQIIWDFFESHFNEINGQ